jgi:hypothetical protein
MPLIRDLQDLSGQIANLLPALRETIQSAWSAHPHPLVTVNLLASSVVVDAYDRQSILEQDDPLRRMRLLQVQLSNIVHHLENSPAVRIEEASGDED